MKRNSIPKAAISCLILGLLLTSLMPIIGRYITIPDFVRGFTTGLGLTLEMIALIKMARHKRNEACVKP